MEMREFGGTGMRASVVGLGCNNFGIYQNAAQAVAVVRKALDVGINFLDMAAEHGGGLEESLVAEALEANCSISVRDAEKAILQ